MTKKEIRKFLLHSTRTGKLATVRRDGRPHVVPIWFDLDEEVLIFTTGGESVKAKNMKRDPRVCICVDDETPPFAFVQIEGIASLSDDLDKMLQWATRIGGRYMGADQAEIFGKRNAVPGELLVRVTPTKIIAWKDVAAW
jgi:PPOX class probable F420-dependent enzyme